MLCSSHCDKTAMVFALRRYDICVTLRWHDIFIILQWHDICITFTTWYLHHIVTRRQCSWECDDKVIVVALLSHDICVTLRWHDICIWLWWGGHARQNVIRRLCLSHCDDNNMVATLRCHDICVTLWWKDICIKLWCSIFVLDSRWWEKIAQETTGDYGDNFLCFILAQALGNLFNLTLYTVNSLDSLDFPL